ncbi:glycosyltransferase family 2 protein [Agaribacter marinus]|uniref:Glycosyl transferase n=1 Tax=Agaribacter marinus TaxID=1431249 RepID=A0AA37T2Q8_9ALTE|nr:glycosyltransferase family 2 protein [Agaribacter marinus]GLR72885.1 glycosyl transferase [Agaribacter marinus]
MTNKAHKVSCIITTYNRPELVGEAIDSVLGQTHDNIELILVDDCSQKDYQVVVEKYAGDERFKYFRNEQNKGLSASRNQGIELASAEFVAFLDDDDIWLPHKLELQLKVLLENKTYVACSSSHVMSGNGQILDRNIRVFTKDNILVRNWIGPPSKLLTRLKFAEKVRFDDTLPHSEDWDFYLRLFEYGDIYSIQEPLIIYNTGHFQRMTTGFSQMSFLEIQKKCLATYKNRELIGENAFKKRMTNYYLESVFERNNWLTYTLKVCKEMGYLSVVKSLVRDKLERLQNKINHFKASDKKTE